MFLVVGFHQRSTISRELYKSEFLGFSELERRKDGKVEILGLEGRIAG